LRDILTVIASLVILVLAAALIAPPFIEWEAHRPAIDRAIAQAAGTQARTEGRIGIRLLPSPRIRVDRLRLGSRGPDSPSLTADFVWSEIDLMPLLRGEVRFVETRIGRADIQVPVEANGSWRLPPDIIAGSGRLREWSIDNLFVAQLLLTTQVPATGRTDQAYAEAVTIKGQKLIGPWLVEGSSGGVPFRLATGELGADKIVQVKLAGGGDAFPRFDVDGRLALDGPSGAGVSLSGKAKLLFGPPAQVAAAGIPIPVAVEATFKTVPGAVDLEQVAVEAGEGGASLRLTGTGTVAIDDPRVTLKLEGRRLDADSFILSSNGQDFLTRLRGWALPPTTIPIELDLAIGSVGLAQEELSNASAKLALRRGRAEVERFEITGPGDTRLSLSGGFGITTQGGIEGRAAVTSQASDRFARYLERLGLGGPFARVLDGRPFEAAAEVSVSGPVAAFRNVRIRAADATLSGNARYTAPEGDARGRLEAQIGIQGLNLDQLPQVSSLFDATQNLDVAFALDARNVRAGRSGGVGRIAARIVSDGSALLVESLDVVDLAGANARVSGRIAPDGSGRIAGRVTAQRAAPLVDLLGSVWIGGVSKLVPVFLREGDLDLEVVTERAVPEAGSTGLRLKTTARGRAAGGGFEADVLTADGVTQNLDVRLATDNTGRWVERPTMASLRRPSNVTLRGTRVGSGVFNVTLAGDVGGLRVTTNRPFALSAADDVVDSGEADVATDDITPFLALLGDGAGVQPPVPVQGRVTLGRERDASLVTVSGRVANEAVQARLAVRSRADITGSVTLDRLSLPWLVAALSLNAPGDPQATAIWSTARFGQSGRLIAGGQASIRAKRLDLGRGIVADDAGFTLSASPEGINLRDIQAGLGGGRLSGTLAVTRQGSLASVVAEGSLREVPLAALAGPSPLNARLSATLKVGASGENVSSLVSNLGGAGEARLTGVQVPNADPGALARTLQRLFADPDPLAPRRAEIVVSEELARGPLTAASAAAPIALVGGSVRMSPLALEAGPAVWQGTLVFDLRSLVLDARGSLVAKASPPGWTGAPPALGLVYRGPLASPVREVDTGSLSNGLAAIVLQRELERIESFEAEANERLRRQQFRDFQRQRERDRLAAEEAARQARLREEQERLQAERVRVEAERLQSEQRARADAERRAAGEPLSPSPSALPVLPPPIDIRPPPQVQTRPGG
jgi:hypothetical protein